MSVSQKSMILKVIEHEVSKAKCRVTDSYTEAVEAAGESAITVAKVGKLVDEYADSVSATIAANKTIEAEEARQNQILKSLSKLGASVPSYTSSRYAKPFDDTKPIRPQIKVTSIAKDVNPRIALNPDADTWNHNEQVSFARKLVDPKPYVAKLKTIDEDHDQLMVAVATHNLPDLQIQLAAFVAKLSVV